MSNNPIQDWKKSSFCEASGCVEVADGYDVTGNPVTKVRDTRGATVEFTPDEWAAFIRGVKIGEFD